MGQIQRTWGAAVCAAVLMAAALSARSDAAESAVVRSVSVTVDLGEDLGQNFGSLFEAKDAQGRTVFGAGCPGVYNTMFRVNRRTLQVFVRPEAPAQGEAVFTPLPRATPDSGSYLYDFKGRVHSFPYTAERVVRAYDPATRTWTVEPGLEGEQRAWGFADMELGGGVLRMANNRAEYDGRSILAAPEKGEYSKFYYALGHIICYHTHRPGGAEDFTDLVAFPWKPGDGPVKAESAKRIRAKFPGETPFAYGQFRGKVLTCSNRGGIYAFDGAKWEVLQAALDSGSYQVYSMLNYYDTFLLAHYPSGELYEYDGTTIAHKPGWPPALAGVSKSSREAQTLAIYGGELHVGVWPWATLWRYDRDADRWTYRGRLFKTPALSEKEVHPWEAECRGEKGIMANDWGQRITGMVALGPALYLSNSSKGAWRAATFAWMPQESRDEYGRVFALNEPGNLAADFRWTGKPTTFEVRFERDRILLLQDDAVLGEAPLSESLASRMRDARIAWGEGVFGPLAGRITERREK